MTKSKLVLALVSLVTGAALLLYTGSVSGGFVKPIREKCSEELAKNPITGIALIDTLLCVTLPFFEAALVDPAHYLIFGVLISLFLVMSILWCVEASRTGSSLLLKPVPILMYVVQLAGAGNANPVLWIPLYLLSNSGDRSSARAIKEKGISVIRTVVIVVTQTLSMASPVAILILEGQALKLAIQIFQLVPIIVPLLYLPFNGRVKNPVEGHRAVQIGYLLAAGFGFAWQVIAIPLVIKDPAAFSRMLALFSNFSGTNGPLLALLLDAIGLIISMLYFVFLEGGLVNLLLVLAASIVIGPATSIALFLAYREEFFIEKPDKKIK